MFEDLNNENTNDGGEWTVVSHKRQKKTKIGNNNYNQDDEIHEDSIKTYASDSNDWKTLVLGWYLANTAAGSSVDIFFDDIYVDNSWRAIYIGNNANWDNVTHWEIQLPTAWSATSITATLNAGTFTSDSTTYLFVIDSDGTASSGYQITFGNTYSSATGLMRGGGAGIGTHGTGIIK